MTERAPAAARGLGSTSERPRFSRVARPFTGAVIMVYQGAGRADRPSTRKECTRPARRPKPGGHWVLSRGGPCHESKVVLLDVEEHAAHKVHSFGGRVSVLGDQAVEGWTDLDGHGANGRSYRVSDPVKDVDDN